MIAGRDGGHTDGSRDETGKLKQENISKLQKKDVELREKERDIKRMDDQLSHKNSELQQKALLLNDLQQEVAKLQART